MENRLLYTAAAVETMNYFIRRLGTHGILSNKMNGGREKRPECMEISTIHSRGHGGDEFGAILQSSFFRIPFVADSSRQSEYFPMMPPNKSLSCMLVMMLLLLLMEVCTHTHAPLLLVPAASLVLFFT